MISTLQSAAESLRKKYNTTPELIHAIRIFIEEHAETLPEKYQPKSIIESRFTPAGEAFEKGILSCGAMASMSAEMLRHLGYEVKLIHGEWNESVDHAWINVLEKESNTWVQYDLTTNDEKTRPGALIKDEIDSWEDIRDQIEKDHETMRERRAEKGIINRK